MRKNSKKNLVVAVLLAGLSLSALATETGSSLHLDPGKSYAEAVASAEKGNWKAADMELEEAKQLQPDLSFAPASEVASLQAKIDSGEKKDPGKRRDYKPDSESGDFPDVFNFYPHFILFPLVGFLTILFFANTVGLFKESRKRPPASLSDSEREFREKQYTLNTCIGFMWFISVVSMWG